MNAIHRTIPIGFNFICEAPDRDSDGNRQENPPEYYHSVCGDSDGLCRKRFLTIGSPHHRKVRLEMIPNIFENTLFIGCDSFRPFRVIEPTYRFIYNFCKKEVFARLRVRRIRQALAFGIKIHYICLVN